MNGKPRIQADLGQPVREDMLASQFRHRPAEDALPSQILAPHSRARTTGSNATNLRRIWYRSDVQRQVPSVYMRSCGAVRHCENFLYVFKAARRAARAADVAARPALSLTLPCRRANTACR